MINQALLDKNVQDYINDNLHTEIIKIVLKKSPFNGVSSQELAEQIQSKKSIQKKLPLWFNTPGIIYPPRLNLEQASSESSAHYKSLLITKNCKLADLTGGFGVDDLYFSKRASQVIHCEINPYLSAIVKHNTLTLGVHNIEFKIGDSSDILNSIDTVDVIYIDPSRRAKSSRVFLLEDCEPNIVQNQKQYIQKCGKLIVKVAPMLDIDSALKVLENVSEIHVVSLNNECKELLFVIEKTQVSSSPLIHCALLNNNMESVVYSFNYGNEKDLQISYAAIESYLYEADAAFLKAGLFKSIALRFDVKKLHQHSHLYTSDKLVENFPGRIFKIVNVQSYKSFSSANKLKKANIIVRNFTNKPDELKKKLKISDGGDTYLYFTTNNDNIPIVITCERLD